MRIELSNQDWPFLRLIIIPRIPTNIVIVRYMIFEKHDKYMIINNNSGSMHHKQDKFYGVHVYLRSNHISLVTSHIYQRGLCAEEIKEEEEAIIKPAAEGTGIPYETRPSQSKIKSNSHYQDLPNLIHERRAKLKKREIERNTRR